MLGAQRAQAAEPQPGDFVVKDFRFHTGEVLPELKLHYVTVGAPTGEPVLVLHGSSGSGAAMLGQDFAGELFGPGQPLDAAKYFIIVPDAIGSGKSSRALGRHAHALSEIQLRRHGEAQYRLVTEHLGIRHVKLVIGHSMGGMQAWIWGEMYPDFMSVLVPMGSQPTAMSGRNWMLRRMLIEIIRADPAWNNGNYKEQPPSFKLAANFFSMATSGGTQAPTAAAPTRAQADKIVEDGLAQDASPPMPTTTSTRMRPRATTTRRPGWRRSRRACLRSTLPTTSATRSSLASSSVRSSA